MKYGHTRISSVIISFVLISSLTTCTTKNNKIPAIMTKLQDSQTLIAAASDDYDDFSDYYIEEDLHILQNNDPFKTWNRFWFGFNDALLLGFVKPTYKVYADVTPVTVRNGLYNLKHNLECPMRFGNAILQGEIGLAFVELGKFIVNMCTSLGFANIIDNDKIKIPYQPKNLRFGYTLATWGVPAGPYLMLPFFGPSTPREGIGIVVDVFTPVPSYVLPPKISYPTIIILTGNNMNNVFTPYETFVDNAFEPYTALKNAYMNNLQFNAPK